MWFLKRLFLLLLLTVGIYLVGFLVLAHVKVKGFPLIFISGDYYNWPGGDTWQRFREFDPKVRRDAVIIGSSSAYRCYDPFVFQERGYQVFNLGTSAQTPLNTYPIIEHFLDSSNCPLLIYDVVEGVFANTGLESTADLTQNQPSDAAALDMAWAIHDVRGLNMMALRMFTPRDKAYFTSQSYKGLGFSTFADSIKTEAGPPPAKLNELSPVQRRYFEASIRLCSERGIRMVVTGHYERRDRRGPAHKVLAAYLDSILTGTGVPYIDYTDSPGIDDRNWFMDAGHLNTAGARIFTGNLVDSLESLGILSRKQATLRRGGEGRAD